MALNHTIATNGAQPKLHLTGNQGTLDDFRNHQGFYRWWSAHLP